MKILLIEDQEKFLKAAKKYFNRTKDSVDYATDYDEGIKMLKKNNYDGLITDIFFPKKKGSEDKSLGIELYQKIDKTLKREMKPSWYAQILDDIETLWKAICDDECSQPLGVAIAEKAEKKNVPFVFSSSLGHHDSIANPICFYQRAMGWPEIVDGGLPGYPEYDKNNFEFWERARKNLIPIMEE